VDIAIIVVFLVLVCLAVYALTKKSHIITDHVDSTGIHCPKCASRNFRFLWDKQIIADDKHLEATPSGFSIRTGQYGGSSVGVGLGGRVRMYLGAHGGSTSGITESYKYKEVSVKTFRISCKCKECGAVWKENVSEEDYPDIKKIPTMQ
jgi:Zn finger protein HypA/HybF involved in hydrogenase expression